MSKKSSTWETTQILYTSILVNLMWALVAALAVITTLGLNK